MLSDIRFKGALKMWELDFTVDSEGQEIIWGGVWETSRSCSQSI